MSFQMRLGDTSLILEVEKDFTVYGDELKFGGGKVCILFSCKIVPIHSSSPDVNIL